MEFDMKHVVNALILGIVYWLLGWILNLIPGIGGTIWSIIMTALLFGGLAYCLKDVKGFMNGVIIGIMYAIVFLVLAIIIGLIPGIGGGVPFYTFVSWAGMFTWPGIWVTTLGILLLTGAYGWVNEQKK
jgi:uncharacterized protein involved in cysteine biosynthesis